MSITRQEDDKNSNAIISKRRSLKEIFTTIEEKNETEPLVDMLDKIENLWLNDQIGYDNYYVAHKVFSTLLFIKKNLNFLHAAAENPKNPSLYDVNKSPYNALVNSQNAELKILANDFATIDKHNKVLRDDNFIAIENTLDFYNRIQIIIARTEYAIESLQNHNQQVAQFIKEIPFKFSVGENKEPFFISCAKKLSQLKPIKDSSFQLDKKQDEEKPVEKYDGKGNFLYEASYAFTNPFEINETDIMYAVTGRSPNSRSDDIREHRFIIGPSTPSCIALNKANLFAEFLYSKGICIDGGKIKGPKLDKHWSPNPYYSCDVSIEQRPYVNYILRELLGECSYNSKENRKKLKSATVDSHSMFSKKRKERPNTQQTNSKDIKTANTSTQNKPT